MLQNLIALALLLPSAAFTQTAPTRNIEGLTVEVLEVAEKNPLAPMAIDSDCTDISATRAPDAIAWGDVIALGEKIWAVIEAGRPVVTLNIPVVHALPRGLGCWADLEHWSAPATRAFEVTYKNGFGMEVVKFRFRLQYSYGGGNGPVGQYLANVTVVPAELNVMWGYTFDANVEVGRALNLGSKAAPIAGLELNLNWKVSTAVKDIQNTVQFFVEGNGASRAIQ